MPPSPPSVPPTPCHRCGSRRKHENGRCAECTRKPKGYGAPLAPGWHAYKHGLSHTAEYRAWQTMRLRCTDPKHRAYPAYGGRGITVCDSWLNDVRAFYRDMGPKPTPSHELDRIDNDGPYSPENCRWTTRKRNSRNRRSSRLLTHDGRTQTVAAWASETGLPSDTLYKRLAAGWTTRRALTTPVEPRGLPPALCMDCRKELSSRTRKRCRACSNRSRSTKRQEDQA